MSRLGPQRSFIIDFMFSHVRSFTFVKNGVPLTEKLVGAMIGRWTFYIVNEHKTSMVISRFLVRL
jgi:hypothetical protein